MAGYLAYIQILDGGGMSGNRPDQGLPQPPPGFPTHPIFMPPYPSTGPGFPTHPIAPGGQPPYPSTGPGFPTHPIAPGGPGGPNYPNQGLPPYPDNSLPPGGPPLFPSQGPGFPTHPIYIPIQPPGGETKPPGPDNLPPIFVWIPGIGWISALPGDPRPDNTLPGQPPPGIDNTLPPTPEPKE